MLSRGRTYLRWLYSGRCVIVMSLRSSYQLDPRSYTAMGEQCLVSSKSFGAQYSGIIHYVFWFDQQVAAGVKIDADAAALCQNSSPKSLATVKGLRF